ncbi:MAG: DNA/RNA nuclease SfsA [Mariniphaga sp.]|nr:DNA/RNA nuclease SfsA [Mariniphaga sp.]MDD4225523.1 DNA/RNA nuclease SfsA [Mariniphaga sp.]
MVFNQPLIHGKLIRRYKRFLADVELDNKEVVVAHCTNSGSMKSCLEPGAEVYLSPATDPTRKTRFTWEMIRINDDWVGIHTGNPNQLALEGIRNQRITGLEGYSTVKREVKFEDSRFDIYAENDKEKCFIEVKSVTLKEEEFALFPDAVTSRGQKHLKTLLEVKKRGMRAVMLYVVQRSDVDVFAPAEEIDPEYAALLREVVSKGVEVIVMQAKVTPHSIEFVRRLPAEI